jgi:serine acetyltransferase
MTSIEIRSDAQVVRRLLIHGTGVVIGETEIVEDDVTLDHRITLAGAGKEKGTHHNPTIGD